MSDQEMILEEEILNIIDCGGLAEDIMSGASGEIAVDCDGMTSAILENII